MFTPGLNQIAHDLNVSSNYVIGATTGFVLTLGVGPLILAPLSETFGRRQLYVVCFSIFALLQLPTALSPNIQTLLTVRTFSGFFGSKYFLVTVAARHINLLKVSGLPMGAGLSVTCFNQVRERK